MDQLINNVLDAVLGLRGPLVYLIVALLAMAETAIFADVIVPGEVGMLIAGAIASRGSPNVAYMIAAATAGAIMGDTIGYWIGRRFGLEAVCRWEVVRRAIEPEVERTQRFFHERGGLTIFFGRFVGALRAVVPVVAGMGEMPFGRFLAWNVAASVAWTTTVVLVGFFLGGFIITALRDYTTVISAVVIALVAGFLFWRWISWDPGRARRRLGRLSRFPPLRWLLQRAES